MLVDTDVLIWIQRGNLNAVKAVELLNQRFIALQTYLELIQSAPAKKHLKIIKNFLYDFNIKILPLTENIGHRAAVYIEEYTLSTGLRAGDALIAATAVENGVPLLSGNKKHFCAIQSLQLQVFKP